MDRRLIGHSPVMRPLRHVRLVLVAALVIGATVAVEASVASNLGTAQGAGTRNVAVGDIFYVRRGARNPTVTVRRGDRVRWRWVGRLPHTVSVSRGPERFSSARKTSGSYTRRLRRSGTYRLFCQVHGAGQQAMTLRVR